MPLASESTALPAPADMPDPACHVTDCPDRGTPLLRVNAWVVHVTLAPAASDSDGVRLDRTGGVPPLKCACRLDPLVNEAVTTDALASVAVTFILAVPSPEAATWQVRSPQLRDALPVATA